MPGANTEISVNKISEDSSELALALEPDDGSMSCAPLRRSAGECSRDAFAPGPGARVVSMLFFCIRESIRGAVQLW